MVKKKIRNPVTSKGDHITVLKGGVQKESSGGIVFSQGSASSRDVYYGVVLSVGPTVKEIESGEVVFFYNPEAFDIAIPLSSGPLNLVSLREESVLLGLSQKSAKALGIPMPDEEPAEVAAALFPE